MKIKLTSYIPGKLELSGEYELDSARNIVEFLESLGVAWDHEALVMVNNSIIDPNYQLQEGDEIHLLIPILGG